MTFEKWWEQTGQHGPAYGQKEAQRIAWEARRSRRRTSDLEDRLTKLAALTQGYEEWAEWMDHSEWWKDGFDEGPAAYLAALDPAVVLPLIEEIRAVLREVR